MGELFNIYCDESCHLENDPVNVTAMVIGGILCPDAKKKEANERIREIKVEHGIKADAEIKWNKVSPSMLSLYMDLINYFFEFSDPIFRKILILSKESRRLQQARDRLLPKLMSGEVEV